MIGKLDVFKKKNLNYIEEESVSNLRESLKNTGYTLNLNGVILESLLDNMNELEEEEILMGRVNLAGKGQQDAALVIRIGKKLLEATVLHILMKVYRYVKDTYINFPTLLGQAFLAVNLYSNKKEIEGDDKSINARKEIEYSLYEVGCSINI